jgi:hypothetical protein
MSKSDEKFVTAAPCGPLQKKRKGISAKRRRPDQTANSSRAALLQSCLSTVNRWVLVVKRHLRSRGATQVSDD